jgi:pyruvate/2-oxoglutarate dehydrogenase complex dihydrolipoamide dehydrogenase (E3) component
VIVATGAEPARPTIDGIQQDTVVTAEDVLRGVVQVGARVVVLGGLEDHLRPLTIADLLAQRGHRVEIVSELKSVGPGVENRTLHQLLKRLLEREVQLTTLTAVTGIKGRSLRTCNVITRRTGSIDDVDTVVIASGGRAVDSLAAELRGVVPEVYVAGDAISPRRLIHAVLDGARVGRQI